MAGSLVFLKRSNQRQVVLLPSRWGWGGGWELTVAKGITLMIFMGAAITDFFY